MVLIRIFDSFYAKSVPPRVIKVFKTSAATAVDIEVKMVMIGHNVFYCSYEQY